MKGPIPAPMMRRELLLGVAVLGLLAIAGPAQPQAGPREHVVTMRGMSFGQIPSNVKVGDTIVWSNTDTVLHSVTARDRSFDLRIAPRKSGRMTAKKAGTFQLYCVVHPSMRGTLKVAGQ